MIDRALAVLAGQLDEALRLRFSNSTAVAALGTAPDLSREGAGAVPAQPVTLTLVRIEEDRTARMQVTVRRRTDEALEELQPDVKLHLYLLVTAAAKDYADSLRYLAAVVGYFQARPVFDHANTPILDAGIDKLSVELFTQSFEEQNHLWGMLALRYVPSVLYRVRLVVIQESVVSAINRPITEVQVTEVSQA